MVCTMDTDVVVILVEKFFRLSSLNPAADIWEAFGTWERLFHIGTSTLYATVLQRRNHWDCHSSIQFY